MNLMKQHGMKFVIAFFLFLNFPRVICAQTDSSARQQPDTTVSSMTDSLTSLLVGEWKLERYSQCLNCMVLDAPRNFTFKKKEIKVNEKKGIYYFVFNADGSFSQSYQSAKINCLRNGIWKWEQGELFVEILPELAPDNHRCEEHHFSFLYGMDLKFEKVNGEWKIMGDEILYAKYPAGWSVYGKLGK